MLAGARGTRYLRPPPPPTTWRPCRESKMFAEKIFWTTFLGRFFGEKRVAVDRLTDKRD